MNAFWQDLRYALRGLRARPGFTVAVIITLGLGIGANAAMFGIVDRLLFRPPAGLRDPASVHRVYLTRQIDGEQQTVSSMAYRRYLDLTAWTSSFSQTAAFFLSRMAVGVGQEAQERRVAAVSASLFGFFDISPSLGRFFTAREDSAAAPTAVAVLSHAYWLVQYGGRPSVLGTTVQMGPTTYTIIGVAPKGFDGPWSGSPPMAYVPITAWASGQRFGSNSSEYYQAYNWSWMEMLVRRKPGVSERVASADLTSAFGRSYAMHRELQPRVAPAEVAKPRAVAASLLRERGPNQGSVSKVATWVSGVAAIVLIVACANVANLLLARALRRRREIAVRLALGVSRRRLISQLLTESVVLAVLGGVVGLLVAQSGGAVLRTLFLSQTESAAVAADGRTLAFTVAAVLVAALLTGLAPMLWAGREDLAATLRAGREGTYVRSPLRVALLVLQGALSVVLLVGAGLFVRSLHNVSALRLGYDIDNVLYVSPNMRGVQLGDTVAATLRSRLLDEAKAIPGVVNATRQMTVPFWWTSSTDLFVAGIDSVSRLGEFKLQTAGPEYFPTVGTRIIRGRGISAEDRAGAPLAAVVSETMAKTLWPGKDAIGQCFRFDVATAACTYVVGIAEDIRSRELTGDPERHYYLSVAQYRPEEGGLYVRTRGDAAAMKESVRKQLQRVMPGASYINVTPMHDIVDPNTSSWRLGATMFVAFGALALVLAAIGLYSVIAYNVAQRTHEFGVRMALGAQVVDIVRLPLGEGVRLSAIGIVVGTAVALWSARWVSDLLFHVSPRDPVVFVVVGGVLLAVSLGASFLPAVRASRVDPSVALRTD